MDYNPSETHAVRLYNAYEQGLHDVHSMFPHDSPRILARWVCEPSALVEGIMGTIITVITVSFANCNAFNLHYNNMLSAKLQLFHYS